MNRAFRFCCILPLCLLLTIASCKERSRFVVVTQPAPVAEEPPPVELSPIAEPTPPEASQPAPSDPILLLKPPQRPEFRELLQGPTYQGRLTEAVNKLPPPDAQLKRPAMGLAITSVDTDSQAQSLGLKKFDIILAVDGTKVWNQAQIKQLRTEKPQQFTVVSPPGQQQRTVTLQPGRIGIHTEPYIDPDVVYLLGPGRDDRWDDSIRVAIAVCRSDPELAETAMFHAIKAGYVQNAISDNIAIVIAVSARRYQAALEFAAHAQGSGESELMPAPNRFVYRAAIADFKLKQAAQALDQDGLSQEYPSLIQHLTNLISTHEALPSASRLAPPPAARAAKMRHTNLLRHAVPMNDQTPYYLNRMATSRPFPTNVKTDHYLPIVLRPKDPAQNVELTLTFTLGPTDSAHANYGRIFAVGLLDIDDPQPDSIINSGLAGGFLGVEFWVPPAQDLAKQGAANLYHGQAETILKIPDAIRTDSKAQYTLWLIHLDGRDEVYLDGVRILYLPWGSATKNVAMYIKSVGTNANISKVRFSSLTTSPAQ